MGLLSPTDRSIKEFAADVEGQLRASEPPSRRVASRSVWRHSRPREGVDSSSQSLADCLRRSIVVKKIFRVSVLATGLVAAVAANAQAQDNPLRAGAQRTYNIVKGYIT